MQIFQTRRTVCSVVLAAVMCTAMALFPCLSAEGKSADGIVALRGRLTQDKVHVGSDGLVSLALSMTADRGDVSLEPCDRFVDLVVVLDRSGSMEGYKINSAKLAVQDLIGHLGPGDRLALISYANGVTVHSGLTSMNDRNRSLFWNRVGQVRAGGGTNLGAGLQEAVMMLMQDTRSLNARKVILLSDGLANQGVTDLYSLGRMAAAAVRGEFAVSTVGVGHDFNEVLMTHIADRGLGTYTFLEDPAAFASVFVQEFRKTRLAVATNLEIRIPHREGFELVDAAGYPMDREGDVTVIRPGSLIAGQARKLYLSFQVPTNDTGVYSLQGIEFRYTSGGRTHLIRLSDRFTVACVEDAQEAVASIVPEEWEQKVLQEDFGRLKQEVADAIRSGNRDEALERIERYRSKQQEVNAAVRSPAVAKNLEGDLDALSGAVGESFAGSSAESAQKRKSTAKVLQYEGYEERRQK